MTPKAHVSKERLDILNFIKIENFYATNDFIKKAKSKSTEWEKVICKPYIL